MTTKSSRAMLVAALLAASAIGASMTSSVQAASPPSITSSVAGHLGDAQKALQKKDFPGAQAAIAAARAVTDKKPYDDYMINRIDVAVEAQAGNMAGATDAAMAAADSPAIQDADKTEVYRNALGLSLQFKHFDKSAGYAKGLEATNPTDNGVLQQIAVGYYLGNDFDDAKRFTQAQIDAATKAGKTPDHAMLQVLLNAQVSSKDEEGAEQTLEKLVAYYNQPDDWTQIIDVAFGTKGIRDVDAIWLGRLLFLSGAKVSVADANMIGATAGHLTFFGDAQNAKANGGTVDPDPDVRANADKKTIPAQIAVGQGPKGTGIYNAKLAEALYSYGMYPEAEAAAKLAIQKGGNPDPSEAPMVLGQAQAAQGKYDDALASFAQVTDGSPAVPRITRLWVAYVNIKKNPPAAAGQAVTAH